MHKKPEFGENMLLIKNPQFLTNFDETLSTGPKNERLVKFLASPSSSANSKKKIV